MKFNCAVSVLSAFGIWFAMQGMATASISTSGLSLWLDANVGVTTSGSSVNSWTDQSGNGHNATQSNAGSQPLFVSNGLNGHATIQFNGGQSLSVAGQPITSQQFTVLAVVTNSNDGSLGFYQEVFSNWSSTNSTTSVFLGTAGTKGRLTDQMGGAVDGNFGGVGSLTNPTTPFIFTGLSGSSDATIYQNSTAIADKGSPFSALNLTGQYNIGTQGGFEFWNGDVSAILVYDRALSQSELQQDWAALDTEFGIPSSGAVPEPTAVVVWSLLGGGGIALAALKRRRKSAA